MILTFVGNPFQNIIPLHKNPYYFMYIFVPSFRCEFSCPLFWMFTPQH